MTNTIYQELRGFTREHNGFGGKDFEEHPEIKPKYDKAMDEIRKFDGQRVKISFKAVSDLWTSTSEKKGRIKVDNEKKLIRFYEGKKRTKYYYLDVGLFEGFFAVLIPFKIEKI